MAVDVGSAVGYLNIDTSGFISGLQRAREQANKVGNDIQKTLSSKVESAGKKMTSVGGTMTKAVTIPVVGAGTAIVKTSATFEAQMSKVQAITGLQGKKAEKVMSGLKAKAMEMGATTKYSATEAGQAMEYMGMAGWDAQQMIDGLPGIMDLAAASGEELGTTSDIVTDALTGFGLQAKDASHFADILAKTSTKSNTTVSMLGESFKYTAPLCGALGYSAEDCSTALGLMANSGIKGSQAGTSLKTAFANLTKPTDEQAKMMKELGITLDDGKGHMLSMREVMINLRSSFGSLTKEQKASAAATLFGKESMSGMLAIINASDEDFNNLSKAIYDCNGTASQMASTMNNNLNGQFTILKSTLETIALQFGEILMPYIKKFVEKLQTLATKLSNLNQEQKTTIARIAGVTAAAGPALAIGGKIVSVVGKVVSVLPTLKTALTALTGPIGVVVAAVAVLAAAFTNLWKNNEKFREKMTSMWNGLVDKVKKFCQDIVDTLNKLGFEFEDITDVLGAIWDAFCGLLAPLFEGAFGSIINTVTFVLDTVSSLFKVFAGIFTGDWEMCWEGIKGFFEGIWEHIKGIFTGICDVLSGLFGATCDWFGTTWEACWNGIKDFFSNIVDWIVNGVKGFVSAVIDFFKELPSNIWNFLKAAFDKVCGWVGDMLTKAKELGSKFLSAIVDFFGKLPGRIWEFLKSVLSKVGTFVSDMAKKAVECGKSFLSSVVNFFAKLPGRVWGFLSSTISKAATFVSNLASKGVKAASKFFNNVVEGIKELPMKVWEFLSNIITKVAMFVKDMGAKGAKAAEDLWNNLVDGFIGLVEEMYEIGKNIVNGLWEGIQAGAGWLFEGIEAICDDIIGTVKDMFGIHSPSRVFKGIGNNVVEGLVVGIKNKKNAAKMSAAELSQTLVTAAEKKLDVMKTFNKISLSDEVGYWATVLKHCKKGTDGYLTAYKNFVSAKQAVKDQESRNRSEELSREEAYWDKYITYHKESLADEVAYWDSMRKNFAKGTDERLSADKKYLEAKEKLQSEQKALDEQYANDVASVYSNLNAKIDELNKAYNDAVTSRTDKLLSSFKLFESFSIEASEQSGYEMIDNLQSQVDGLKTYANDLNALASRGIIPEDLMEEIKNMGVDAAGEIAVLNTMTDEELSKWVVLWQERSQLAMEQAKTELTGLRASTEESIVEAQKAADIELEKLETTYKKKLEKMNTVSKQISKKTGKNIPIQLANGIAEMASRYKSEMENLLEITRSYAKQIGNTIGDVSSQFAEQLSSKISSMSSSVGMAVNNLIDGSHASGLDRVPYDGYIAELHEGERVLTKDEARAMDANGTTRGGDVFIFNSPEAIDEREAARQMKRAKRELALDY